VAYLERYFLFDALGVRCYLHRFVGSDPDRGIHNHPWQWALSLVLLGFYQELRRDEARGTVRWFNFITSDTLHRVLLPPGRLECWTLFLHSSKKEKRWGFWRDFPTTGTAVFSYHDSRHPDGRWEKTAPLGNEVPRDENGVALPHYN